MNTRPALYLGSSTVLWNPHCHGWSAASGAGLWSENPTCFCTPGIIRLKITTAPCTTLKAPDKTHKTLYNPKTPSETLSFRQLRLHAAARPPPRRRGTGRRRLGAVSRLGALGRQLWTSKKAWGNFTWGLHRVSMAA